MESSVNSAFEEASKLKSEFLANARHEIRTPVYGTLAARILLMDTVLTDELNEFALNLAYELLRLIYLIL